MELDENGLGPSIDEALKVADRRRGILSKLKEAELKDDAKLIRELVKELCGIEERHESR